MRRGDALDQGSFGVLPYAGWAWESLRRNPDYRQEYFSIANHYHNQFKLKAGGDIVRLRRLHKDARKWGLCFFENPELCANHAQVFWDPNVFSRTLKVRVQNGNHGDKFTDGLNYADADVRKPYWICPTDAIIFVSLPRGFGFNCGHGTGLSSAMTVMLKYSSGGRIPRVID